MKKLIYLSIFFVSISLSAQIQVAELLPEGIVFPRMNNAQMNSLTPVQGQCIYNTTFKAVFCHDGNTWKNVAGAGGGTPFRIFDEDLDTGIETALSVDDDTLRFFVGSINEVMKHDGKTLHVYETGESVFIGEEAGTFDDLTTNRNTAVGHNAAKFTVGGSNNVAVGNQALRDNAAGNNNVAIGKQALFKSTASNNVGIGLNAGLNSVSGNKNVSVGGYAGSNNATGNNNTVVGYEAGQSVSGSNPSGNVLIGHQAGMNINENNRLYIANDATDEPLVYGEFDESELRVNGTLEINDPVAGGFALPPMDGDSLQVLATNGAGEVEWANFTNTGISFAGGGGGEVDFEKHVAVPQRSLQFFLDLPGVIGTSMDVQHVDEIVCYGYDFKRIGINGENCNNISFSIIKEVDRASPVLQNLMVNSTPIVNGSNILSVVTNFTGPSIDLLTFTFGSLLIEKIETEVKYAGSGTYRLYEKVEFRLLSGLTKSYRLIDEAGNPTGSTVDTFITCSTSL